MNLQSILSERENRLKELLKEYARQEYLVSEENHPEEDEIKALNDCVSFHAETARLVYESALSAVQEAVGGMKKKPSGRFDQMTKKYNQALSSVSERIGELRKKI